MGKNLSLISKVRAYVIDIMPKSKEELFRKAEWYHNPPSNFSVPDLVVDLTPQELKVLLRGWKGGNTSSGMIKSANEIDLYSHLPDNRTNLQRIIERSIGIENNTGQSARVNILNLKGYANWRNLAISDPSIVQRHVLHEGIPYINRKGILLKQLKSESALEKDLVSYEKEIESRP